jgi:hypothetical protein
LAVGSLGHCGRDHRATDANQQQFRNLHTILLVRWVIVFLGE